MKIVLATIGTLWYIGCQAGINHSTGQIPIFSRCPPPMSGECPGAERRDCSTTPLTPNKWIAERGRAHHEGLLPNLNPSLIG